MNNDLAVFIPTKDRPLLFDGLVQSIDKFCEKGLIKTIYVLEKSSNNNYRKSYDEIYKKYKHLNFYIYHEVNFNNNFLHLLSIIKEKYVLGMTDDTLFYNYLTTNQIPFTKLGLEYFAHVLRLGENCIVQDPLSQSEAINIINVATKNDFGYEWEWIKYGLESNLGYPFSLDGLIYNTKQLLYCSQKISFTNLREWESHIISESYNGNRIFNNYILPKLSCNDNSVTVNVPKSMVQYPFNQNVGPYSMSTEYMQNLFNSGKRIDLKATFENVNIIGSHQFINFFFT